VESRGGSPRRHLPERQPELLRSSAARTSWGANVEQMAEGLQFPEGPIAMADGSIVLVEIRRGTLTRVAPDGQRETIADLGGGPNGAAIGPDGAVYVCNNGGAWEWAPGEASMPAGPPPVYRGGSIQRVDLRTGTFTTLYESCDGKPLNKGKEGRSRSVAERGPYRVAGREGVRMPLRQSCAADVADGVSAG
jgi:sugar lactone lactonase YvrE